MVAAWRQQRWRRGNSGRGISVAAWQRRWLQFGSGRSTAAEAAAVWGRWQWLWRQLDGGSGRAWGLVIFRLSMDACIDAQVDKTDKSKSRHWVFWQEQKIQPDRPYR